MQTLSEPIRQMAGPVPPGRPQGLPLSLAQRISLEDGRGRAEEEAITKLRIGEEPPKNLLDCRLAHRESLCNPPSNTASENLPSAEGPHQRYAILGVGRCRNRRFD